MTGNELILYGLGALTWALHVFGVASHPNTAHIGQAGKFVAGLLVVAFWPLALLLSVASFVAARPWKPEAKRHAP